MSNKTIEMAREAGIIVPTDTPEQEENAKKYLERFAALVRADEREQCVQIVEREASQYADPVWAVEIVNDIRERGNQ